MSWQIDTQTLREHAAVLECLGADDEINVSDIREAADEIDRLRKAAVKEDGVFIDHETLQKLHRTCDLLRDDATLANEKATKAGRHAAEMTAERDSLKLLLERTLKYLPDHSDFVLTDEIESALFPKEVKP